MKLLFLLLVIHIVLAGNQKCRNACKAHGVGGRRATSDDKGPYGFDNPVVDCTCVFSWFRSSSEHCRKYCDNLPQQNKFCAYISNMCIPHIGLNL